MEKENTQCFEMRNLTQEQAIALAKQQEDVFLRVAAEMGCNLIVFGEEERSGGRGD